MYATLLKKALLGFTRNVQMTEEALRQEIVDAARRMNSLGINQGTSGNLSARANDGLLLTPSGQNYEFMKAEDLVHMDWDGDWKSRGDNLKPTSEWRFHLDILRVRKDVDAIVHVHSPFATALSTLRRDIPAFHYMVAMAGGAVIRCAEYATFGTEALSEAALNALEGRNACLLANHGMISCGSSVSKALALAVEVEALAGQYMRACQVGDPAILSDEEMTEVLRKFQAGYGFASGPNNQE